MERKSGNSNGETIKGRYRADTAKDDMAESKHREVGAYVSIIQTRFQILTGQMDLYILARLYTVNVPHGF